MLDLLEMLGGGGGLKVVMAELLPVKGIYLCDFLLFSISG